MKDLIHTVLNTTIIYDNKENIMWNFLKGNSKKVKVIIEAIPVEHSLRGDYQHDAAFRQNFQHWVNGIWENKSALLREKLKD